jgi:hypothetical protein
MRNRWRGAPVALMVAAGASMGPAAMAMRQSTLPTGSVLQVRLNDAIGSDRSQRGDRFTATVTGNSGYGLPSGTRVEGVVTDVQRANNDRPGMLDVDFRQIRLPGGETYRIAGSATSLDSHSVQRASDGRMVARSTKSKDKTKFIAYGAGAGFLIGSVLGKNVVGGLLGAAAGYLYGQSQKSKGNGHDVVLKPGTEFGVRMDRQVALGSGYGNGYRRSLTSNSPRAGYNNDSRRGYENGLTNAAGASSRYNVQQAVFPAGSVLKVKLDDTLSSDRNHAGDRFTATVSNEDTGYNLPAGTRVEGVVSEVKQASSDSPGMLDVDFRQLRLPDGQSYPIVGAATSLDSNSVQRDSDGRLVARSTKSKDKTKFIAYGAGAGFLIGSLLGSNIKGGLLGAAAGYLYGQSQKNKGNGREVVLKPGTEFGVRLDQRLALAANGNGRYPSRVGGYRSNTEYGTQR